MKTLQELYKELEAVMHKHSNFGAEDTEPDSHFQHCIKQVLDGESLVDIPANAESWELYTCHEGVEQASKDLIKATENIIDRINNGATFKEIKSFKEEALWRVY